MKAIHRQIWEEKHGKIPKGWVVIRMNGDNTDNKDENLACIPRNPAHIGQVIPPFRERIKNLERLLKELKEKK